MWPVLLTVLAVFGLISIWVRVQDEEAMLREEFGREWEEYHRRTKRFQACFDRNDAPGLKRKFSNVSTPPSSSNWLQGAVSLKCGPRESLF